MKVSLCQVNVKAGDISRNATNMTSFYKDACNAGADLVVFPELAITGYPPEDLLLKPSFLRAVQEINDEFAAGIGEVPAIVGTVHTPPDGGGWLAPRNAAALCQDGKIIGWYWKQHLPNYGVFDEKRYFMPGPNAAQVFSSIPVLESRTLFGISICEDAWVPATPLLDQATAGAQFLVNISASPYSMGRLHDRYELLSPLAAKCGVPILYCNLVVGLYELVFDGGSFAYDQYGNLIGHARQFEEDILTVDLAEGTAHNDTRFMDHETAMDHESGLFYKEVWEALVLGTRDYVRKNGFQKVLIGLSGGIDSSLVAAVAVEALGAENVFGIMMPSRFSSGHSVDDAELLAQNLGIEITKIPIAKIHAQFTETMTTSSGWGIANKEIADENIQARIRGNILMYMSNANGWMVLTTGNKSEMACGYATLYGDMAGGFAVIKDVPKTMVFDLCRWLGSGVIPQNVIDKPPSAELRPDQQDTDSLPPYEILDPIIEGYVEQDLSAQDLIVAGYPATTVHRVIAMIDRNEYKRRQAPPGVRVSPKAFGKDRRLPITNGWTG